VILTALLGAALPVWAAMEALDLVWPSRPDRLMRFFLAVGLGTGLSSCVFLLWLQAGRNPGQMYCWAESALCVVAAIGFRLSRRFRLPPRDDDPRDRARPDDGIARRLSPAFVALACVAVAVLVLLSLQQPHGAWDGWAYWNMRARFLLRGGEHWTDSVSPEMQRVGRDYPLLLPATVARLWCYAGNETVFVPIAVGILFTLAAVGLVSSTLISLERRLAALLAGAALLGTNYFIRHGVYQYADTQLSYYILAAAATLYLARRRTQGRPCLLALSGLMAALAAWTKNEGLLFLVVLVITHAAVTARTRGWRTMMRETALIGLGLLPVLALVLHYKLGIAPRNDLFAAQDQQSALAKLLDPGRHWAIAKYLGRTILGYGNGLVIILVVIAVLMGRSKRRTGLGVVWALVALMLAGYWIMYAVTPQDLQWHLGTSARRLFLQVQPMAVMAFFLWIGDPAEIS